MTLGKPLIGISLDSEENGGGYSALPWYALRKNYCQPIVDAGGIPIPLPHHPELAEQYSLLLDGIVLTGGDFDVPPHLFGETVCHDKVILKPNRTDFEYHITHRLLHQNKPILGICGGMQLLNVVLGGTLIQHIPDDVPQCLAHEQPNPRTEPGHTIAIQEGTLLHHVTATLETAVNSAHHQAVKKIAPSLRVNAYAPDGIIEGIESPDHKFCLGVQWHPEYQVSPIDQKIFNAFIAACDHGAC